MKISRCSVCLLTGSELIPPRPCFCIGHCTSQGPALLDGRYTGLVGPFLAAAPRSGGRRRSPRAPARRGAARTVGAHRRAIPQYPKWKILRIEGRTRAQFETSARGAHTHIATCNKAERCVANSAEHRSTTRPPTVVRLCDHSTRNHDKETANSSPLYGRMGLSCARGMSPPRSLTHAPRSPAHRPRRPTAACRRPLSRTT